MITTAWATPSHDIGFQDHISNDQHLSAYTSVDTMVPSTKTRRTNTPKKQPKITAASFSGGTPAKTSRPNASILSFFQKSDKPEDSLFVGAAAEGVVQDEEELYEAEGEGRYNEVIWPVKRRKVNGHAPTTVKEGDEESAAKGETEVSAKSSKKVAKGPFVMSDSEDDGEDDDGDKEMEEEKEQELPKKAEDVVKTEASSPTLAAEETSSILEIPSPAKSPPILKQEESSLALRFANMDQDEFAELEDEDLDDFEGEETRVMRFMQEQARIEAEASALADEVPVEDLFHDPDDGSVDKTCPMCQGSIAGLSTDDTTRHVNQCMDGTAPPLSEPKATEAKEVKPQPGECSPAPEIDSVDMGKRFNKSAVPRPAQLNPLEGGAPSGGGKSAFSKLMSNNAEDTAWATAAATEKASRGKPAYERTCPFYKIMPGFAISVDAFRYGAVEGCKAYFLSHFHSDHYIGLTARWTHGPIYCSKVTGSLVRRQLRTADKWVVDLEFDKPYDIPGTDGATVTMIPANHCPGSSLFLFEKTMGSGQNPHTKRILHCGDFRACPAHIEHPLLRPDLVDSVSGKVKQQKIDICYLDTTYLNPRYSFPPQNDVIQACADLCGNMSPDPNCKDDVWERSAKALGTPAVSKYFNKVNAKDEDTGQALTKAPRQRLLIICGTYSIGKERICLAIANALDSKIFASPGKIKICKQLGIPELTERLTSNPLDAQVHMQMLMEIRAETLQEYLNGYKPHFSRIVGFRPSGWNFRPTSTKTVGANTPPSTIPTEQILHGKGWRTRFGYKDFVAQRGSTGEAMCFGVPYSEHSSFRELAMFIMSLRIEKVIPTVNVGSDPSRTRMKAWNDRWVSERRRCGLMKPLIEGRDEGVEDADLWEGKAGGKGGHAWW